ncbi:MAG: ABC transporter ATP-binding protein, partial [Thermoplasmata archaeon]|nr:ABC transporter ATP-binding protein [Thermoplasmata archaeon]
MTALLEARDLFVSRGGRVVLKGTSLGLGAGEAVALVGPNAAGKSTFVRALAGLLQPASGLVLLEGRPIPAWPRDALARTLSLVTPEEGGAVALTVRDRVALGRYPHRGPFLPFIAADDDAVERSLRQTGILELAARRIG